jgi:hypothetical protein
LAEEMMRNLLKTTDEMEIKVLVVEEENREHQQRIEQLLVQITNLKTEINKLNTKHKRALERKKLTIKLRSQKNVNESKRYLNNNDCDNSPKKEKEKDYKWD